MSDTPQASARQVFQAWRVQLDAEMMAGVIDADELLALMYDLRHTLDDVAHRLQAGHEAAFLGVFDDYARKRDLVLELPPRKPKH